MKTKQPIGVAVLLALAFAAAYWIGYQHGRSATQARLKLASSPRQIGLSFRHDRNDLSAAFTTTGGVAAQKNPAPER